MAALCSFLWLGNISLCVCVYTTSSLLVRGASSQEWLVVTENSGGAQPEHQSAAFRHEPLGWGGWVGGRVEEEPRLSSESQCSVGCLLWSSVGLWIWEGRLTLLQEHLTEFPNHTDKEYLWMTPSQYPVASYPSLSPSPSCFPFLRLLLLLLSLSLSNDLSSFFQVWCRKRKV